MVRLPTPRTVKSVLTLALIPVPSSLPAPATPSPPPFHVPFAPPPSPCRNAHTGPHPHLLFTPILLRLSIGTKSAGSEAERPAITFIRFSCQLKRSDLTPPLVVTNTLHNGEPSSTTSLTRRHASPPWAPRRPPSSQRPHANAISP